MVVGLSAKQSPRFPTGLMVVIRTFVVVSFISSRFRRRRTRRRNRPSSAWSDPATRARRVDHAEAGFR
jgi:hypothetical protein